MENNYLFELGVTLFLLVGMFFVANEYRKQCNIQKQRIIYLEDLNTQFAGHLVAANLRPILNQTEFDLLREYKLHMERVMHYPELWDTQKFPTAHSAVLAMYCLARRMGAEYFIDGEKSDV